MEELLKRAGFRLRPARSSARGSGRADCAHCKGRSTGTVSYTPTVAYCHRCGWRSSKPRLQYELDGPRYTARARKGVGKPAARKGAASSAKPPSAKPASASPAQAMAAAFRTWLDEKLHAIAMRERQVYWAKRRASACLEQRRQDPEAWLALVRLTGEEEWLDQLWDFLTGARDSRWWNPPVSEAEIFAAWRNVQAACLPAPRREA